MSFYNTQIFISFKTLLKMKLLNHFFQGRLLKLWIALKVLLARLCVTHSNRLVNTYRSWQIHTVVYTAVSKEANKNRKLRESV